jgi:GNAT superfamily N-acetyltransferase
MAKHSERCDLRHPPGDEIYRDGNLAVFEVDGQREPIYCENLCYLSKLFLDHKTLTYEVDPFLFYCMCEYNEEGYQIGGYFSKEKEFSKNWDADVVGQDRMEKERNYNNLSCILVLPFHQRKGYGKFLISFSYELGIVEGKQGTPERPLSDLGHKTYSSWWSWKLLNFLKEFQGEEISVQYLAESTGILQSDITNLFESFKILRYHQGTHYFVITQEFMDELIKRAGDPGHLVIRDNIHWTGYEWYNIH